MIIAMIPADNITVDHCDLIERNHYYDGEAREVFVQWIFWRWSNEHADYVVQDWRLDKGDAKPEPTREGWRMTWQDKDEFRRVFARQYRETWTTIPSYSTETDTRKTREES